AERPIVLVLEDLHWADAESLDLLRRVGAEAGSAPLLVLATHRDLLPERAAAAIADVRRDPGTDAVPLRPLTEAEVGEYVGGPGADAYRRTGGLPLLLAAGGDLRVVVAGMLAALSPADRAVVEALALLGDGAGPRVLAEVAGTDPEPALAAARRAGLLGTPTEDGTPFAHALLQDGVRAAVPPATAVPVHERAAGALSERLPGRAAAHWRAAGRHREAADCAVRAAEQAGRALALDDAVRHLQDAADSLAAVGAGDAELAEALVRLATAEFVAGRIPDSAARSEAAADAATRAARPDLVAQAALVLRGVTNPYVAPVVESLCRRALAADPPTAVRARLLSELAAMAAENGDPAEADQLAAEALRLAEQDGDALAVLDAARARELTLPTADSVGERLRLASRCRRCWPPAGSCAPATSWPASTSSTRRSRCSAGWSSGPGSPWHAGTWSGRTRRGPPWRDGSPPPGPPPSWPVAWPRRSATPRRSACTSRTPATWPGCAATAASCRPSSPTSSKGSPRTSAARRRCRWSEPARRRTCCCSAGRTRPVTSGTSCGRDSAGCRSISAGAGWCCCWPTWRCPSMTRRPPRRSSPRWRSGQTVPARSAWPPRTSPAPRCGRSACCTGSPAGPRTRRRTCAERSRRTRPCAAARTSGCAGWSWPRRCGRPASWPRPPTWSRSRQPSSAGWTCRDRWPVPTAWTPSWPWPAGTPTR